VRSARREYHGDSIRNEHKSDIAAKLLWHHPVYRYAIGSSTPATDVVDDKSWPCTICIQRRRLVRKRVLMEERASEKMERAKGFEPSTLTLAT
jgi:hypothetical protein